MTTAHYFWLLGSLICSKSHDVSELVEWMLNWDVTNGIAGRGWFGNANAKVAIVEEMDRQPKLQVTINHPVNRDLINQSINQSFVALDTILNYYLFTNNNLRLKLQSLIFMRFYYFTIANFIRCSTHATMIMVCHC